MLTREIQGFTVRGSKGQIGMSPDLKGGRVDRSEWGVPVQLGQTALSQPAALIARAAALPSKVKGQKSEVGIQPILGAEPRTSQLIGHLEELASAQGSFEEAGVGGLDFGLLVFVLALMDLIAVNTAILSELSSAEWPVVRLMVFGFLVGVDVVIMYFVKNFSNRLSSIQISGRIANAKKRVESSLLAVSENYPREVEAWGGIQTLSDTKLVAARLQGLRSQLIGSDRVSGRPGRDGLILGLGVGGMLFPLLAIIAWAVAASDLKEMKAGTRDRVGKSQIESARTLGKIATLAYGALIGIIFLAKAS